MPILFNDRVVAGSQKPYINEVKEGSDYLVTSGAVYEALRDFNSNNGLVLSKPFLFESNNLPSRIFSKGQSDVLNLTEELTDYIYIDLELNDGHETIPYAFLVKADDIISCGLNLKRELNTGSEVGEIKLDFNFNVSDEDYNKYIYNITFNTTNNFYTLKFNSLCCVKQNNKDNPADSLEGEKTSVLGINGHAEGYWSIAQGTTSHAEGYHTDAIGDYSHSEGRETFSSGLISHAEGYKTVANGAYSHSEGNSTNSQGIYSHSEGYKTEARGEASHAEGGETKALGSHAHAEGNKTKALSICHAEGGETLALSNGSHSEGYQTIAAGMQAHAEGAGYNFVLDSIEKNGNDFLVNFIGSDTTWVISENDKIIIINITDNTIGRFTIKSRSYSSNEEINSLVVTSENSYTLDTNNPSNYLLCYSFALDYSHSEGSLCSAFGDYSHAENRGTKALGRYSHSEGYHSKAIGESSHAEGYNTKATGVRSHAEGSATEAKGYCSHTEGSGTVANGGYSHVEGIGSYTTSKETAIAGHAEGYNCGVEGRAAHAEGEDTRAFSDWQHVQGRSNIIDSTRKYLHIVGNGDPAVYDGSTLVTPARRSNAHTLDWDGNAWFAGNITTGSGNQSATVIALNNDKTLEILDANVGAIIINKGSHWEAIDAETLYNDIKNFIQNPDHRTIFGFTQEGI